MVGRRRRGQDQSRVFCKPSVAVLDRRWTNKFHFSGGLTKPDTVRLVIKISIQNHKVIIPILHDFISQPFTSSLDEKTVIEQSRMQFTGEKKTSDDCPSVIWHFPASACRMGVHAANHPPMLHAAQWRPFIEIWLVIFLTSLMDYQVFSALCSSQLSVPPYHIKPELDHIHEIRTRHKMSGWAWLNIKLALARSPFPPTFHIYYLVDLGVYYNFSSSPSFHNQVAYFWWSFMYALISFINITSPAIINQHAVFCNLL